MMARRRPALRGPFCCCGPSRWVHGISRACEILKRLLCVVRRSAPASDRGHQHRDAPDAPLGRLALAIHGVLLRHRRFAIAVAGAAVLAGLVVAIAAPALKGTANRSRVPPRLGIASATAAENARPAQSSPSESVQVGQPSLSRPLRSIRPVRRGGKSSFKSFEAPLRGELAAPPSTKAGSAALQRSAPRGLMPPRS